MFVLLSFKFRFILFGLSYLFFFFITPSSGCLTIFSSSLFLLNNKKAGSAAPHPGGERKSGLRSSAAPQLRSSAAPQLRSSASGVKIDFIPSGADRTHVWEFYI
jgi:hypothetical protein